MRPRDFLEVLENPALPACEATGEAADLLRALLVHLFFADLDLDKRELALLQRVLPAVHARDYVTSVAARKLDLERLAALFPDPQDRRDIVALAQHAVWGDDKLERRERNLIDQLISRLAAGRSS